MALYENPDNNREVPTVSSASMLKTPRTGVDVFTSWTLDFQKLGARADCKFSFHDSRTFIFIHLRLLCDSDMQSGYSE